MRAWAMMAVALIGAVMLGGGCAAVEKKGLRPDGIEIRAPRKYWVLPEMPEVELVFHNEGTAPLEVPKDLSAVVATPCFLAEVRGLPSRKLAEYPKIFPGTPGPVVAVPPGGDFRIPCNLAALYNLEPGRYSVRVMMVVYRGGQTLTWWSPEAEFEVRAAPS